ncbi:MAG: hypothetical protein ACKODX_05655, partial [Gemmata sp.]
MAPDPLALVLLAAAAVAQLDRDTASGVRSLPVRVAQAERPVHLTGVVTFCPPPHGYFYVQDGTGGLRVEWPRADKHIKAGDRVEVQGVTTAGTFLPEVRAEKVLVRERNQFGVLRPVPFNLTLEDSAYLDGQYVEVEAVVQRAWATDKWLQLDLARGRGNAVATLPLPLPLTVREAERLSGAVVRVAGVCGASTRNRQVVGPARLFVSKLSDFKVLQPPPAYPTALPLTAAADLTLFRPDPIAARLQVRVTGTVTIGGGGNLTQLYLQDSSGVVYVFYTNRTAVQPGQKVSVVGFPRPGTDPARLENAHVRIINDSPLPFPDPVPASVADAVAGRLDGRIVTLAGTVLDTLVQGGYQTATLFADGVSFTAVFSDPNTPVAVGSRIEVSGVVNKQPLDKFRPHTFAVIVHSGKISVLEGPPPAPAPPAWWTGRRVAYLSAGFLTLFLAGGAGAAALRLQVRRATALARQQHDERQKLEGQLMLATRLKLEREVSGYNDPAQATRLETALRRAGEEAAALTRQLLLFSRQRPIAPYPLGLNETVGAARDVLERVLGDRIAVRLVPGGGLPLALAEPADLYQVLLNLAANAADAMPGGGTFTLTTS